MIKINDTVIDLEMTERYEAKVLCKVYKINKFGIFLTAIDKKYLAHYPHRFNFDELHKIGKV